jgi:hypothetical protein
MAGHHIRSSRLPQFKLTHYQILALLRAHKSKGGDRAKRPFQFLNIIGARALGRHIGRVLEMVESSADKWEYEAKIAQRFGFAQQLELPMPIMQQQAAAN